MENIPLNFKGFNIIIPTEGLDLEKLEDMAYEISKKIGKELIEKVLEIQDEELMKERPRGQLSNEGKRPKYMSTRLGEIRYWRRAYKEKGKEGYRYLLDEELKIKKNQRVSKSRKKIEDALSFTSKSYRAAEEVMEKMVGESRSHETMRQGAIKEGEKIKRHEGWEISKARDYRYEYEGEVSEVAYIEADSTGIKVTRGKRGRKRIGKEIKLGIGYTGWEDRYKSGNKKQKKLKGKFIYGGIEDGCGFMENLSLIGEKEIGISKAMHVVVGGDGAEWIKNNIKSFFGIEAIYQLCRYHLNRAIKRGLGYDKVKESEVRRLVKGEKIEEGIKIIDREIIGDRGDSKKLMDLRTYILRNQEGINGIKKLKAKKLKTEIRKTGAIEGNIDKVIAGRFKKRGMRWSIVGADGLLKVGIKILNNKWDEWWKEERDEKIEIREEDIKRLIPINLWDKAREEEISRTVIPAMKGPHQDRPWVQAIKGLTEVNQVEEVVLRE